MVQLARFRVAGLAQIGGHIKADATGADDRHLGSHRLVIAQQIQIAEHLGVTGAGDIEMARLDPGRHHNVVVLFGQHIGMGCLFTEAQLNPQLFKAHLEVAQGLAELLFTRDLASVVELATNGAVALKQGHAMAPFGGGAGCSQAGRAGTNHRHKLAVR